MSDVARLAGVSPMTVSRVINGEGAVQPDTRDKVRAAVAELGYVPNPAARSLAGARQYRLALLHDNPSAAFLSELLVGALAEAARSDALLVVEPCAGIAPEDMARHLAAHRVEGVILPPPLCEAPALLAALDAARLPMVQVATGVPHPGAFSVGIDDEAAAFAMTTHLIALGHERIGLITGDPNLSASDLRRRGYQRALAQAGLSRDPMLEEQGYFTWRSGMVAAEALLALPQRPTAIFASNDDMAAAAVATAHRRGLEVPRDLSVCGFDDTSVATMVWPEMTTIRQPVGDMARAATRLLIDALEAAQAGQAAPEPHQRLHFQLMRRQSDARVPRNA
jgi:LacI family transcriptional regulator